MTPHYPSRFPSRESLLRVTIACLGVLFLYSRCSLLGGGSEIIRADGYDVEAPKEWKKSKLKDVDRAFELPSGNRVTVNSSCRRYTKAPLDVMARHLLIGNRGVKVTQQEPVAVAGGEGLLTKATAREGLVEVHLTLVLVRKQDCLFDVVHLGKREISGDEQKQLIQLARGLTYGTNETAVGAHQ